MEDRDLYEPPAGPPPLLTYEQMHHLAFQGWLLIDLQPQLSNAIKQMSEAATAFFDKDIEEKRKLYPPSRGTECGFYHVPDEKEYITLRFSVHPESELETHARHVWKQAGMLLYRILVDISRAAGYDLRIWDHLVHESLSLSEHHVDLDDVITLLRLFRYYPTSGVAEKHVDVGLLTLCVGEGKGLQLLDRSQSPAYWVDATGPVILVADTTRALMRNQVRAGVHRVIGNPQGRTSTVFALRPCLKYPTDLSTFGGRGEVDTRAYFYKIKGAKYNINATNSIRNQQRQRQRERKGVLHSENHYS
ncbi:hypothetical protein M433DRAFT_140012 [Acidomyces richmondensis BFW]|nr:hypothetical protein M433DRAFT_140012 [Acidomyces richmondensis BFW]